MSRHISGADIMNEALARYRANHKPSDLAAEIRRQYMDAADPVEGQAPSDSVPEGAAEGHVRIVAKEPAVPRWRCDQLIRLVGVMAWVWSALVWIWTGLSDVTSVVCIRRCFGYRSRVLCYCCRPAQARRRGIRDNDKIACLMWVVLAAAAVPVYQFLDADSAPEAPTKNVSKYILNPLTSSFTFMAAETTAAATGIPLFTQCVCYGTCGFFVGLFQSLFRSAPSADGCSERIGKWFGLTLSIAAPVGGVAGQVHESMRKFVSFVSGVCFSLCLFLGTRAGDFCSFLLCCQYDPVDEDDEPTRTETVPSESRFVAGPETETSAQTVLDATGEVASILQNLVKSKYESVTQTGALLAQPLRPMTRSRSAAAAAAARSQSASDA